MPTPKAPEMVQRWKLFARQIEADLSLYHHLDFGEWHVGNVSSRKVMTLLDGLPNESWYKLSVHEFIEEMHELEVQSEISEVRRLMLAQLHGQKMEVVDA
jgi:hypothetical protein